MYTQVYNKYKCSLIQICPIARLKMEFYLAKPRSPALTFYSNNITIDIYRNVGCSS